MNLKEIFETIGTGSEHKLTMYQLAKALSIKSEKIIQQIRDLKADGLPLICFEGGWWVATIDDREVLDRYLLKQIGKDGKMTPECSVDLYRLGNMIMANDYYRKVEV